MKRRLARSEKQNAKKVFDWNKKDLEEYLSLKKKAGRFEIVGVLAVGLFPFYTILVNAFLRPFFMWALVLGFAGLVSVIIGERLNKKASEFLKAKKENSK